MPRPWLVAMLWLLAVPVRAQETVCDPNERDCGCERNWGCWDLLYTTPGTILGMKATLTQVGHGDGVQHGVLAAYATEHFGTRRAMSGHFAAHGTIGGGSAGNEGSLGGTLDFGVRAPVTDTSGPFARLGIHGMLLGNEQLFVSLLEPALGRVGYQLLDGDTLLEVGLTTGFVATGRYRPAGGTRDLSATTEVGAYAALHLDIFRIGASIMHIPADSFSPRSAFDLLQIALCSYPGKLGLCADLLYIDGAADYGRHAPDVQSTVSLYAGFTVGLTP